jgi:hypothetical protein
VDDAGAKAGKNLARRYLSEVHDWHPVIINCLHRLLQAGYCVSLQLEQSEDI